MELILLTPSTVGVGSVALRIVVTFREEGVSYVEDRKERGLFWEFRECFKRIEPLAGAKLAKRVNAKMVELACDC